VPEEQQQAGVGDDGGEDVALAPVGAPGREGGVEEDGHELGQHGRQKHADVEVEFNLGHGAMAGGQ
jgi:hypothetical protein